MKKFLLSLLTIAAMGASAIAAPVTFDFAKNMYGIDAVRGDSNNQNVAYVAEGTTTDNGGVTITFSKTAGNGFRFWSDGLRVYKEDASMTVDAGENTITTVVLDLDNAKYLNNYSVDGDTITGATDGKLSISCDGKSVKLSFAVREKSLVVKSMEVYLNGEKPAVDPEPQPVEVEEVATLTEFVAKNSKDNVKITGAVTVVYQQSDKSRTFITDGTTNLLVYGKLTNAYKNGDQLTGIIGKMSAYNGMDQMVPDVASFGTATEGTAVQPVKVAVKDLEVAQYSVLEDVEIAVKDKNLYAVQGTDSVQVYNRFSLDAAKAAAKATITGFGAIFKETKQIYYTDIVYTEGGGGNEDPDEPVVPGEGATLDVNDATDIVGTTVEATANAAKHIQPLESFVINGYAFTFSKADGTTAPAYYYPTDAQVDKGNTDKTLRMYKGTTMIVKAPAGVHMTEVVFTCAKGAEGDFTTTVGTVTAEKTTEFTWKGESSAFGIKFPGTFQIRSMMVTTGDGEIAGGEAFPLPVTTEVETIVDFFDEQNEKDITVIKETVTVTYQNGKYLFVTDGESSLQIFGDLGQTYKNGDQLTGIAGKYAVYGGVGQMTPDVETFGAATEGAPVDPAKVALGAVKLYQYVQLDNVSIVSDGEGHFNVTDGETTKALYDRFKIEGIGAADNVTIIGIGTVYNGAQQIYPISISDSASISEINAGAAEKAVIYDLQGRRLAAPVKGVNIINGKKILF